MTRMSWVEKGTFKFAFLMIILAGIYRMALKRLFGRMKLVMKYLPQPGKILQRLDLRQKWQDLRGNRFESCLKSRTWLPTSYGGSGDKILDDHDDLGGGPPFL